MDNRNNSLIYSVDRASAGGRKVENMIEVVKDEEVKILEDVLKSLPQDAYVRYEPADVTIPPTLTSGSPKKVYEIAKKYGFLDEKVTVNIDGRSVYIEGLWEVDLETMFNEMEF